MARRTPETSGTKRVGAPWDWQCSKGHYSSTPAGIFLLRCPLATCSSPDLAPVSPEGNPIRTPRR